MADNFKNGVRWYTRFTVDVFFPENKVSCRNCIFLCNDYGLNRCRCRMTERIVYAPDYPELPDFCPLQTTGEIVGTRKESV